MEFMTAASSLLSGLGGLGGSAPAVPAMPPVSVGGLNITQTPKDTLSRDILTGIVVVVLGGLALAYIQKG